MAGNQVRRFVILPTRGFVATETTGHEALNALFKLQNPGVMAFERVSTPFRVKVLASLHENGPKPVAMPGIDLKFADSRSKACAPLESHDGKGVKVGVLDTGAGPHNALVVTKGVCAVFGDTDQSFTDTHGHGTHVAGVIAAKAANFTGIAPAATLHAYRVFPRDPNVGASNFDNGWHLDGLSVRDRGDRTTPGKDRGDPERPARCGESRPDPAACLRRGQRSWLPPIEARGRIAHLT